MLEFSQSERIDNIDDAKHRGCRQIFGAIRIIELLELSLQPENGIGHVDSHEDR